jgi:hypothetical protein
MGLDFNNTRFLLWCRDQGVDFTRTATLGRQGIFLSPEDQQKFGLPELKEPWCEPLLKSFGAKEIYSYDYSPFEGATEMWDFNLPLPYYRRTPTIFIDFGAIEHIFNFPVAIENCQSLVSVGGHYIASMPANCLCGHGFYQFSSDLIYSVFEQNGFHVERLCYALEGDIPWVDVPRVVDQGRVMVRTTSVTYFLLLAKKLKEVPFTMPQQSDYVHMWRG